MKTYNFVTIWRVKAPIEPVWNEIYWNVETTKRWMNLLAPIARPLFEWNHNVVMNWGAEGLEKRLGASVSNLERVSTTSR